MQLFINMWCYLQWLFTYMYIHNLITYSCTKSIKMLWGLFLPMTNLLISFHQKSSVLLHEGSTFIHSLLWCSANFCNTSQNMHSYAPVASKHWTRNPYLVSFQGCWTQWQRFQSSTIHHFWDTPQHFLKTHFCWESDFLSFLELQKYPLYETASARRRVLCWSMLSMSAYLKQMVELGQVFRWNVQTFPTTSQMKWPRSDVRWSTQISCQIYTPKMITWSDQDQMWDEVPR